MSDKPFNEHLADKYGSGLGVFLLHPLLKRLEKGKELFKWQNDDIYSVFEKYAEFIKREIEDKTEEEIETYFHNVDENLQIYLDREYQYILPYLPYILWFSHLIFDSTYSQLTYEAKKELRDSCNLKTPKKRKDAFINSFARFVEEKVVDGGKESNWNELTRLLFLSYYEKFSIVIEIARNDLEELKKQKIPIMDIKKEILGKYKIPEDYWNGVLKERKDRLARNWAKVKMLNTFDKKITE